MKLSIKYKFMLGVFVIVMMAILSFAFLSIQREKSLQYKNRYDYAVSLNRLLAGQIFSEMLRSSNIPLNDRITLVTHDIQNLTSVEIYSETGNRILDFTTKDNKSNFLADSLVRRYSLVENWFSGNLVIIDYDDQGKYIVVSPIVTGGVELTRENQFAYNGICVITYSNEAINKSLEETQLRILQISAILLLIALLLAYIAAHYLVSAIQYLIDAVRRYQNGEKNIVVETTTKDEVGDLGRSIQELMVSINTSINILNDQKIVLEDMTHQAKHNELKFRNLLENARDMIIHFDADGNILYANQKFIKLFLSNDILSTGNIFDLIIPENKESLAYYMSNIGRDEIGKTILSLKMKSSTGQIIESEMTCNALNESNMNFYQAMIRDVTDRTILREELVQAKKMESIGRLAGGIAHDFNNLLAIIIPNAELVLAGGNEKKIKHYADQILSASQRAGAVVKQLLDFSRQKPAVMKPSGLHQLLGTTVLLLEKLMSPNIRIIEEYHAEYDIIEMEETQIQQILINMAINARDAMPDGGELIFATKNIRVAKDYAIREYIQLNITDTGTGIDDDVLPKIFDPFFTTKGIGDGTGLGLAGAYGIVQLHHGTINVQSEKNKGTTFTITFPLHKPFMI